MQLPRCVLKPFFVGGHQFINDSLEGLIIVLADLGEVRVIHEVSSSTSETACCRAHAADGDTVALPSPAMNCRRRICDLPAGSGEPTSAEDAWERQRRCFGDRTKGRLLSCMSRVWPIAAQCQGSGMSAVGKPTLHPADPLAKSSETCLACRSGSFYAAVSHSASDLFYFFGAAVASTASITVPLPVERQ
jgi:hypothetical protein